MKNLMKLLVLVIVFAMATETFAQKFWVKGGMNLSNILEKDNDDTYSDDYKMKPGFHVGATAEFPINEMFSFETGLLLSTKGMKMSEEEDGDKYEASINLLYLDIPINAKASFDIGGAKLFGTFGPYIGMGLSGKSKYEVTYEGETETEEETIEWGSDDEEVKRLDFGLAVGAGVEIKSFQIGLTYALGLANISPDTEDGYKINNRVLGISLGYKFGGK